MYFIIPWIFISIINTSLSQWIYESDINFRVEPGAKSCFYEQAKAGQVLEVHYQVVDGQHGDLDISFDIFDPNGLKLASDHKKSENSIILHLEVEGEYGLCLDNTFSLMNSKLVYVYVLIESETEIKGEVKELQGNDDDEEEVYEWTGVNSDGETYYVPVTDIANSLTRTLRHVTRARYLLDMYGAKKSRDSYLAFEETFIVDVWSAIQISMMIVVGFLQVYMIKKLFNKPKYTIKH